MIIGKNLRAGLAALAVAGSLNSAGCEFYVSQPRALEHRISQEVAKSNGTPDKYALLITSFHENRFLHNLGLVYDELLSSGFQPEHIYVLGPEMIHYRSKKFEIDYPIDDIATKKTIERTLSHLEQKIDSQDILVVHITGHGERKVMRVRKNSEPAATGEIIFTDDYARLTRFDVPLEGDAQQIEDGWVTETDLERYLSNVNPKFAIVSSDICYGGGIAKRVGKNNVIGIAPSGSENPAYLKANDSFGGFFYEAFNAAKKSDVNGDGQVTVDEAFEYARARHTYSRDGIVDPQLVSELDASKVVLE